MLTVNNIHKSFKLYKKPSDRLKEIVLKKQFHRVYNALNGVSFTLSEGQSIGILGENGAGKSTLLKLIMGIILPDSGHIERAGKITGLLELGTGFNPEYSGRQNIYFNGAFLNLTKKDIDNKLEEIIDFAEIGDFIDEPLKTYSSGMTMRLAFSIAIHANPKCLVVDEALSVGDVYFQQKCFDWLKNFKESGNSFVFVSHDLNAVKMFCDRSIVLNEGNVVFDGQPEDAVEHYSMLMAQKRQDKSTLDAEAWDGNRVISITSCTILNRKNNECSTFTAGDFLKITIHAEGDTDIPNFSVGIMLRNRFGQEVYGINTDMLKIPVSYHAEHGLDVEFSIDNLNLGPGLYTVTAALHDGSHHLDVCYHWVERAGKFEVVIEDGKPFTGLVRLTPKVTANATTKILPS